MCLEFKGAAITSLEGLYYGNISPTKNVLTVGRNILRFAEIIAGNEEKLNAFLKNMLKNRAETCSAVYM